MCSHSFEFWEPTYADRGVSYSLVSYYFQDEQRHFLLFSYKVALHAVEKGWSSTRMAVLTCYISFEHPPCELFDGHLVTISNVVSHSSIDNKKKQNLFRVFKTWTSFQSSYSILLNPWISSSGMFSSAKMFLLSLRLRPDVHFGLFQMPRSQTPCPQSAR